MIYADYNGSAPLLPSVREHLKKRLDGELFANPSAIHSMGQKLNQGIERCREIMAGIMACHPSQIYFNSGSSEGVNQIIQSILENAPKNKNVIISTAVEHAVVNAAISPFLERGHRIEYVQVDEDGRVQLDHLKQLLEKNKGRVALLCLMAANNETGVVQPYLEAAKLCQEHGVEYFCDTTQLIGKGEFYFETSGVDYAVCSGHKLGALTGTGFFIAKDPSKLRPLVFGSIQEKGLRGGTEHYLGIETLAIALKDHHESFHQLEELRQARLSFEAEIKKSHPRVIIIGEKAPRLAGTTLIGYPGLHGQAIQIELETHDIFVTTSAACSDNQPETSKVLRAMGIDDQIGRSVVRISLSYTQGEKEYAYLARALKAAYNKLNKIESF